MFGSLGKLCWETLCWTLSIQKKMFLVENSTPSYPGRNPVQIFSEAFDCEDPTFCFDWKRPFGKHQAKIQSISWSFQLLLQLFQQRQAILPRQFLSQCQQLANSWPTFFSRWRILRLQSRAVGCNTCGLCINSTTRCSIQRSKGVPMAMGLDLVTAKVMISCIFWYLFVLCKILYIPQPKHYWV